MKAFKGFSGPGEEGAALPRGFFTELLPAIDHLGELKVTLYLVWRMPQVERPFPYLWEREILEDTILRGAFGKDAQAAREALGDALDRAVRRGSLLKARHPAGDAEDSLYFLNSPKGQAGGRAVREGSWDPAQDPEGITPLAPVRPDIYRLYEANIGPLTPMMGETLAEAEETYPGVWIEEAFRIAVENNVRRWRYVAAILRSWQEEGRDERESGRDPEADRRRYVRGKFAKYIEH
jgi:DnaD/phage-associated family protein